MIFSGSVLSITLRYNSCFFIVIKYTQNLPFSHYSWCSSVAFSICLRLYTCQHCEFPKLFHYPKQKLGIHQHLSIPSPALSLSVFTQLPVPCTSYKWNHTLWIVLCLAYSTRWNVFKFHPCCVAHVRISFPFRAEKEYTYSMICIYLLIHSPVDGHWAVSTSWPV